MDITVGDKVKVLYERNLCFKHCDTAVTYSENFMEFLRRYKPINMISSTQILYLTNEELRNSQWKVKYIDNTTPFYEDDGEPYYRIILMNEKREIVFTWTDGVELIN